MKLDLTKCIQIFHCFLEYENPRRPKYYYVEFLKTFGSYKLIGV